MAEKRKPETVLWVRHGTGRSTKVEVFNGSQFADARKFTDKKGRPIDPAAVHLLHRLRVNGVWFPAGKRYLFTTSQCAALIKKDVFKP